MLIACIDTHTYVRTYLMLTMTSEEIVSYVRMYVDNTKCSLAMVDSTT